MIRPAADKSFDPVQIFKTIRNAGFDSPKVQLTLKGRLELTKAELFLKVPGLARPFRLEGETDRLELLRASKEANGIVRVSGLLQVGKGEDAPAIEVQDYELQTDL